MARGVAVDVQVKSDFEEIWTRSNLERLEDPPKQKEAIRSAHKFAICISLMAKAVKNRPDHERVFLQEAASDSIHLIHALINGDGRGGVFYLRSIIENFWRHHYFRSHPVEYGWLHTRPKYHLTMKDLREHCGWLDCFSGELKKSLATLDNLYADLSTEVHSTSSRTLMLRETLDQIKLSEAQTKKLGEKLRNVMKDVIVLTISASDDVFSGLHFNSQEFVMKSLDNSRRTRRESSLAARVVQPAVVPSIGIGAS